MPTPKQQVVTINISSISLAKILMILGAIGFLYLVKDVVAAVFVSLIFSSALSPWVVMLEKRRIPRPIAIWLIYILAVGLVITAIVLLIPPLTEQTNQLITNFPQYSDAVVAHLRTWHIGSDVNIVDQIKNALKSFESVLAQAASGIFSRIIDVISGFVGVLIILVMTYYMTVEDSIIKRALETVVPARYQTYIHSLLSRIQTKIGLWIRAQVILCCIIAVFAFIALSIFRVKYALILALIAGLTEFIPMIGPIIGAVPAVFIALGQSPWLALCVIIIYILIQRLENDILVPAIMRKAVGINPLVSIIAILIGAKIGGVVGVMLAIPVVTALGVVVGDFFGAENAEETLPEMA